MQIKTKGSFLVYGTEVKSQKFKGKFQVTS